MPSLAGYKAAFLLGPVNLTANLKEALLDFAASGGQVVVSSGSRVVFVGCEPAGVVGPNDADLTGISELVSQCRIACFFMPPETQTARRPLLAVDGHHSQHI